jgi:hypothetical protein
MRKLKEVCLRILKNWKQVTTPTHRRQYHFVVNFVYDYPLWHEFLGLLKNLIMPRPEDKNKKTEDLRDDAKIRERNSTEKFDTEQTRIENRREADLEDKTPAGDAGVEDNKEERRADDPIGESNY